MRPLDIFQQGNVEYIEQLHQAYLHDPNSVDRDWALFFAGFEAGYAESPATADAQPAASDGEPLRATRAAADSVIGAGVLLGER